VELKKDIQLLACPALKYRATHAGAYDLRRTLVRGRKSIRREKLPYSPALKYRATHAGAYGLLRTSVWGSK